MDDHHGEAGTDRHDGFGLVVGGAARDRPHQSRGHQVHALDHQPGTLGHGDDSFDQISVGRSHQHPAHFGALGRGVIGEDLRREDGLVGSEGDDLFGMEPDGTVHFVVRNERKLDFAGDGPKAGNPDDHGGGGELAALPQATHRF